MSDEPTDTRTNRRRNRFIAPVFILGGVAALALLSWWNPTPSCTNVQTTDLVSHILTEQLKLGPNLHLENIRIISGNMFSGRYECEAEVSGISETAERAAVAKLLGIRMTWVHYTSEKTADTGRQYVTARMIPSAAPATP
jgi:hypothetical protein